jgi:predicted transcriptional regulator of viral defense system
MRKDAELITKIHEIEASHSQYEWTPGTLDWERKLAARAKIWGILYAMGYGREQIVPLDGGELPEIITHEPIYIGLAFRNGRVYTDYCSNVGEYNACTKAECKNCKSLIRVEGNE